MLQLFARKPIADLQPPEGPQSLKRVLGAGDLVMLALSAGKPVTVIIKSTEVMLAVDE